MAVHFTKGYSPAASVGSSLGTGLAQGLSALAQEKTNDLLQKKKQAHLSKMLQGANYDQNSADLLSYLAQQDPNNLHKYLEMVGSGQSMGGQQVANAVSAPEQNLQQQMPFAKRQEQEKTPLFASKAKQLSENAQLVNQSKAQQAIQQENRKEALSYVKSIRKEAHAAQDNDMRLDRMEALINTGKLNNPKFVSLIKSLGKGVFGFGIDLTSTLTPESQQFDKLSTDFLKSAKDIFGTRITNNEIDQFLKTVPTLMQSNAGKVAVIENLRAFNKASKIKKEIANKLYDYYGANLPANFEQQVEELAAPELDAIAQQFKTVNSQNPAASAGNVGTTPGLVGGALTGAGLGARVGAPFGLPGVVSGAGLGALGGALLGGYGSGNERKL